MEENERTLDELIAELNQMRGRMDVLRQLAHALIYSHPAPGRLAEAWSRVAPAAEAALDPAAQDQRDAIDAQIRAQGDGGTPPDDAR